MKKNTKKKTVIVPLKDMPQLFDVLFPKNKEVGTRERKRMRENFDGFYLEVTDLTDSKAN